MSSTLNLEELLARGHAHRDEGDLAGAETAYLGAVAATAGQQAEPYHHLGGALRAQGRLDEAEAAYRRVLALAPDAWGTARLLADLLLIQGRYAEGFPFYEARHQLPNHGKPVLPYPEWRGEDLNGKRLLIWPEQGLGDQIQCARFAPILKARGAEVTLLCNVALVRLFKSCLEVSVLAAVGAVEFPDPDYWVMAMSIPARMGLTADQIPGAPYLHADAQPLPLPPGARVGVATNGNPVHENDAHRSLSPDEGARLRRLPGAISLDPAVTGAKDMADTAAIIAALDLVIAVDTSVVHLAGAMGKPCWTLVPAIGTDWRWFLNRAASPWYPSMRLYRQPEGEGWGPVLDRVEKDFINAR